MCMYVYVCFLYLRVCHAYAYTCAYICLCASAWSASPASLCEASLADDRFSAKTIPKNGFPVPRIHPFDASAQLRVKSS